MKEVGVTVMLGVLGPIVVPVRGIAVLIAVSEPGSRLAVLLHFTLHRLLVRCMVPNQALERSEAPPNQLFGGGARRFCHAADVALGLCWAHWGPDQRLQRLKYRDRNRSGDMLARQPAVGISGLMARPTRHLQGLR